MIYMATVWVETYTGPDADNYVYVQVRRIMRHQTRNEETFREEVAASCQEKWGAGAEIYFAFLLVYRVSLNLRLGLAHGFVHEGETQFYLHLGTPF